MKNTLSLIAHCLVQGCSDCSRRQEIAIEQHFSRVKSACRGQPSLKDGVIGTVRTHLRQLADLDRGVTPHLGDGGVMHGTVSKEDLCCEADKALKLACCFQTVLDPHSNMSMSALDRKLHTWWRSEGCELLTKVLASDDGADSDGSSSGDEKGEPWGAELSSEAAADENASTDVLESCEDRLRGQTELAEAAEFWNKESAEDKSAPTNEESIEDFPKSCYDVLRGIARHQLGSKRSSLNVLQEVSKPMDAFITGAQLASGLLSRAQLTQDVRTENRHNIIQHHLALARQQAQMTSGKRTSRFNAWQQATSKAPMQHDALLSCRNSQMCEGNWMMKNALVCTSVFETSVLFLWVQFC